MNEIGGVKVKLTADVDSTGTVKGYAQVEQATKRIQSEFNNTKNVAQSANAAITTSTQNTAKASKTATRAFGMQKNSMQQLGYQIQDVAVMSQFGADKFIILGTQGSQIASLFGPGGALFGAFLAIGAAIIGVSSKMNQASKETEDLAGKLKELSGQSKLTAAEQSYLASLEKKSTKEKKARIRAIEQEISSIQDLAKEAKNFNTLIETSNLGDFVDSVSVEKATEKSKEQIKAEADKLIKLNAELSFLTESITRQPKGDEKGTMESTARIDAIKANIQKEQQIYKDWQEVKKGITAGLISDEQAQLMISDRMKQDLINSQFEQTARRLEEERTLILENQNMTAEQKAARMLEINEAERQAKELHLQQMQQQEVLNAEQTAALLASIEKKKSSAIMSMQSGVLNNAMGLLDQFAGQSKIAAIAAIAINKGLSLAQNTQNTLVAQTRALAELGPIAGPPVAAKIGMYGAINAGLIAATGLAQAGGALSGSNSAQTFSGGVPAVNTTSGGGGAQQPNRNISIALTGSGFSGNDIRSLIAEINDELGDGVSLSATGG